MEHPDDDSWTKSLIENTEAMQQSYDSDTNQFSIYNLPSTVPAEMDIQNSENTLLSSNFHKSTLIESENKMNKKRGKKRKWVHKETPTKKSKEIGCPEPKQKNTIKEKPNIVCDICKQQFPFPSRLKMHQLRMHAAELGLSRIRFKCRNTECSKDYANKFELIEHEKQCIPEKFACTVAHCTVVLDSSPQLEEHIKDHESQPKQPKFACSKCGKSCRDNHEKRRHEEVCLRSTFSCRDKECKKNNVFFLIPEDLREHREKEHIIALGKTPHRCTVEGCYQVFNDQRELAQHQVTHTKEKMFVCDYCNKSFTTLSNCRRHMNESCSQRPLPTTRELNNENI